jgi:hypothetical protein
LTLGLFVFEEDGQGAWLPDADCACHKTTYAGHARDFVEDGNQFGGLVEIAASHSANGLQYAVFACSVDNGRCRPAGYLKLVYHVVGVDDGLLYEQRGWTKISGSEMQFASAN